MLWRRWRECRCEVKGGAHESESRASSSISAAPPCSDKRKREYRKRSGLERLNSRLADGCMLHSHSLRGQGTLGLKIITSMIVMLAAANVSIESQRPEQVRSLIKALAA